MELSVVIVNWNTRDMLGACLRSLLAYPARGGQEILVVDNASADGSAAMVRGSFSGVRLIEAGANLGYATANNLAIREAAGQYALLLNPDTELTAGALDAAIQHLREHPDLAAVSVRLVHPDGRTQRSCRGFPTPLGVLADALGLARLFPRSRTLGAYRMTWFDHLHDADVDQPMGTFLMIPMRVLREVGLMDEQFPIFFNEVDWCYRARKSGRRIRFLAEPYILHHGGESTRQVKKAMIWESHRSLYRFFRKHGGVLAAALMSPVLHLGAFVRARGWSKGFVPPTGRKA